MDELVLKQKTYDRTLEWNEAGWDGSGITIWDLEPLNTHGTMTMKRLIDAAPGCKVLNYGWSKKTSSQGLEYEYVELEDGTRLSGEEFVKNYDISILSHSHGGHNNNKPFIIDMYKNLKDKYNVALFNSAGNDGCDGVQGGAIPESMAIYVGAAIVFQHNFNDIRMAYYSSLGDEYEEVDFTHFVGPSGWNGTSFSCPYLAGIAALLQQRYGRDITQNEMYAYFKMIAKPINSGHMVDDRYDYWSGYGMPILPPVDKKYVRMTIGSKEYKVDGEHRMMDTAPFIQDQRTFVPIAFAALALDAQVSWDNKERKVTITKNGTILQMYIGKETYLVNGKPYTMDVAPFIKDSRTFVPIAFVALALNCKVAWCAEDGKVLILES